MVLTVESDFVQKIFSTFVKSFRKVVNNFETISPWFLDPNPLLVVLEFNGRSISENLSESIFTYSTVFNR